MRREHPRWIGIAWFVLVLVFVISMIIAAFFLTGYIYKIIN